MRRDFLLLWAVCAVLGSGCGGKAQPPGQGPPNQGPPSSPDSTEAQLQLAHVPRDVECLRVQATGSRTVQKDFDVQPGQGPVSLQLGGVPLGSVVFTVDGFALGCGAVVSGSPVTWKADPVAVDTLAGQVAAVALALRRGGPVDLTVDFFDEPICVRGDGVDASRGPFAPPADAGIVCGAGGTRTHELEVTAVPPRTLIDGLHHPLDGPLAERRLPPPPPTVPFGGDDNLYSGIWLQGNEGYASWFTTSWQEFTYQWEQFASYGLRMHDFETYLVGSTRVFAGLFKVGTGGHAAWFTSDGQGFLDRWAELESEGLRMHDFDTFVDNGTRIWVGIFREGTGGHAAWITSDWNEFQTKWAEFERLGLRMHDFEAYEDGGQIVYAGIFREGSGGHAAWITSDWDDFVLKWGQYEASGLRMHDFETYLDGRSRVWAGVFRPGAGGHAAWIGVDWESFISKWHENDGYGLRLHDFETYPSACPASCLNQLVMPHEAGTDPTKGVYDYNITSTATHCNGLPGTCGNPAPGTAAVTYHQPVVTTPQGRYVRFSAVSPIDPIFTLPFSDATHHNGWLYGTGSWHHAIDYSIAGDTSFEIKAAAPGKVVHVGWDAWSGGTIVVSHDVGAAKDVYRTIHMHVRNGANADCDRAWNQTYEPNKAKAWAAHYKYFLEQTGCTQDPASRMLDPLRWGTDSETLSPGLLGKTVGRGEVLAHAGSTGPGGCGCMPDNPDTDAVGTGKLGPNTHLHIFFAKKDPTDDQWYFFDPYGIYAPRACYPDGMTDPVATACARYPIAWKDATPQLP